MSDQSCECLCAGIVVADHLCAPVAHVPSAGELVLTESLDLAVGGCAANVAVDLARLGVRNGIVGRVGADVFGRFVRETLAAAGVGCDLLRESPRQPTSGTLIVNVRGEDRRFVHCIGANGEFDASEITPELVRSTRVLYLGGYCLSDTLSPERVADLFRMARDAGVSTALDVVIPGPGDYRRFLEPVLPWTDVFLPNNDEGRLITGEEDPLRQAETFRGAGAKTVVITCGVAGAVLVDPHHRLQAGRYPVEFVDGTGSGDAFVAGYIYGLLKGADVLQSLRFGSALGASCVRAVGATAGIFTADELEAFVAGSPLEIRNV